MATPAQIASPGVYVTDDIGLEVTDGSNPRVQIGLLPGGTYGLRVIAADGTTVIIDGTSDMFRIAATGSASTSQTGAGISTTVVSVSGTGLSGTDSPAFLAYITEGTSPSSNSNREVGRQLVLGVVFAAPTSGGATTTRVEAIRYSGGVVSSAAGGLPTIAVYADQGEGGATVAAFTMRWYLLRQVGI